MVEKLGSRKLVAFIVGCAAIVALRWHGGPEVNDAITWVSLLTGGALGIQGFLDLKKNPS